jgi:hypothetical protein
MRWTKNRVHESLRSPRDPLVSQKKMLLRSQHETSFPTYIAPRTHKSWENAQYRINHAVHIIVSHRDEYPRHFRRALYHMIADTLIHMQDHHANPRFQGTLKNMIMSLEHAPKPLPRTARIKLQKLRTLTSSAIAKRRWGVLRASCFLLGLQARAVITANHPERKRKRGEFEDVYLNA